MANIFDDMGYVQIWKHSKTMEVRTIRRADYIVGKMRLEDGSSILEIGCGTGELSKIIAGKTRRKTIGIDICASFIEQAKKTYSIPNLEFKVCDFNNQADVANIFSGHKFDYVIGNGILHHLFYNLDNSLLNINKLLKNNGKMIFLEPNLYNPYCFLTFKLDFLRKLRKQPPDEMGFSAGYIRKKLLACGFKDILVEYKDFLIPGTPEFMIKGVIAVGGVIEKIPVLKMLSQSIFISAVKK